MRSVGPLVLLALDISGAWIGNLTAFERYRPVFIAVTVPFFGLAFRKLYLLPQPCAAGAVCADPLVLGRQRIVFWAASILMLGLLAAPWAAPLSH